LFLIFKALLTARLGNISDYKLREMRRTLKQAGVRLQCREKVQAIEHAVMDSAGYEGVDRIIDGKKVPNVQTNDVRAMILGRIDELFAVDQLVWHAGMPRSEIWVKIVGDKGDVTTKLGFQIVNRITPNSAENTVIIGTFCATDSYVNIAACFGEHIRCIGELNGFQHLNKTIRVFVSGDCEFLARIYGLSTAASTHPCFLCCVSSKDMQTAPHKRKTASTPRTVANIAANNDAFVADGSRKSRQKLFLNAIQEPIFTTPLDQVVPPWLHITLGLVLRIHENILQLFRQFSNAAGALEVELHRVLSSKGIDRNTYHSNSFHGNACHLYLSNIPEIFTSLSEFICLNFGPKELADDEASELLLQLRAHEQLFKYFREIDNMVGSNELMGAQSDITKTIQRFMRLYRRLKISVSLKSHLLEEHVVPFVTLHQVSLGLMGEQGIESAHHRFKTVKEKKTRDPMGRLLWQTKRYAIQTRVKTKRV
jgi:hypothetical protein